MTKEAIEKLPESSKIQIKESAPGVLSITATGEGKETFHVSATDANDGSIRFEKEISVKSISAGSWVWKQIRVPIIASVIILVIAIVFLILMFAGRSMGNHSRRKTGRTISTWQNGTWKESKMQLERSD